jgi:hypothetical protein
VASGTEGGVGGGERYEIVDVPNVDGLPLWYSVAAFHRASGRRSRRRTLWHLARPTFMSRIQVGLGAEVSQMPDDGDNPGLDKFHVYIWCFAAWAFERGANR